MSLCYIRKILEFLCFSQYNLYGKNETIQKKIWLLKNVVNDCNVLKVEVRLFIINYYLLKIRLSIIIDIKMFIMFNK